MTENPVDRFLSAMASGTGIPADLYSSDALLDATVPHWRFDARGGTAIVGHLNGWYAAPAVVADLRRTLIAGGEIVRFSLRWTADGEPMEAHQVHLLDIHGDKISRQDVWCGGQWDAALQTNINAGRELS